MLRQTRLDAPGALHPFMGLGVTGARRFNISNFENI